MESNTMKFTDVYSSYEEFLKDYHKIDLGGVKDEKLKILYYLLYAKYGNDHLANYDVNQFKYKLFTIVMRFGPAWESRLELQEEIKNLTIEELMKGSKQIFNHAFNPGGAPNEQSLEELDYINEQNTTNYKRSKADAIALKWELLKSDVSEYFIQEFKYLFKIVVADEEVVYYSEECCRD